MLAVKFLAFLNTTAKKLGDQYIVGLPNLVGGDQSPPVPTVVAPMLVYKHLCNIHTN